MAEILECLEHILGKDNDKRGLAHQKIGQFELQKGVSLHIVRSTRDITCRILGYATKLLEIYMMEAVPYPYRLISFFTTLTLYKDLDLTP